MRLLARWVLFGSILTVVWAVTGLAAEEPAPLLKPVNVTGSHARVRLPVTPGEPTTMSFTAQLPHGTNKQEMVDVVVALDTLHGKSYVSAKKWESWGYNKPNTPEVILPELYITAGQIAPKPMPGHDVVVRLANLKLTILNNTPSPDGSVFQCDLSLSAQTLFGGNDRSFQPHVSFSDKYFELTVPQTTLKKLGTSDFVIPEVTTTSDPRLTPVFVPHKKDANFYMFEYAAINGVSVYRAADKSLNPVKVTVASITNTPTGIIIPIGLARECKVEMDEKEVNEGLGVEAKTEFITGKVKEMRIAVFTGPGFKTLKDLVIKDLDVHVNRYQSQGRILIGQKFIDAHFADGIYAADVSGYKLYGRVDPERLVDIKTRPKQKP
ncbi:MAG: hypothetical protein RMJ56_06325 [Gemmataceae bacterium]|nr:hypothetical protein [Gemmata sp.]MDW8197205.1 hypothetical protein [Gemmataceae bacterium]